MRKKRAVASGVGRFTKRPVTIEAVRYREDITIIEALDVCDWIISGGYPWITHADADAGEADKGIRLDPADGGLIIRTLEGDMKVSPGDWIIRGAAGEFYPCKPDIFEATYAPAADGYAEPPGFGVALCASERLEMARERAGGAAAGGVDIATMPRRHQRLAAFSTALAARTADLSDEDLGAVLARADAAARREAEARRRRRDREGRLTP